MERRNFVFSLLGVVALCPVNAGVNAMQGRRRYGFLDRAMALDRGYLPAKVLLDGVDVSDDVASLDDEKGFVVMYLRNAQGKMYLRDGDVAKAKYYGTVVFLPHNAAS